MRSRFVLWVDEVRMHVTAAPAWPGAIRPRRKFCAMWLRAGVLGFPTASASVVATAAGLQRPASSALVENESAPFSISLVPAVPIPIRLGATMRFRVSSSIAGYANLYLIAPVGEVSVLAESLPLAAGYIDYPPSAESFTLVASQPVGFSRVVLLVTRQPFAGFSGSATLIQPVSLALPAGAFLFELSLATARLARVLGGCRDSGSDRRLITAPRFSRMSPRSQRRQSQGAGS